MLANAQVVYNPYDFNALTPIHEHVVSCHEKILFFVARLKCT